MTLPASTRIDNYFVCIGAQKAGTTWLARMLSRHPQVFVTPVKEIHYFDHVRGVTQHLADRKRRSRLRAAGTRHPSSAGKASFGSSRCPSNTVRTSTRFAPMR